MTKNRERGVQRVIQLLEFVHRFGSPIRIGELSRKLEAPRSSVYELVGMLVEAELLAQTATGEVFFGKRLHFYGLDFLRENDLLRRGRDEVDRLAHETGETSQLCILSGRQYTVVHVRQGSRPFRINSDIGTQIPLPWTASGRLFLSHLSPDEIRAFIAPEDLLAGRWVEGVAAVLRQPAPPVTPIDGAEVAAEFILRTAGY